MFECWAYAAAAAAATTTTTTVTVWRRTNQGRSDGVDIGIYTPPQKKKNTYTRQNKFLATPLVLIYNQQ